MAHIQEFPPLAWTVRVVLGMIGCAITVPVLYYELKKRRLPTTQFQSHYLRFTSAVCIWSAPITPIFLILSVIPGFCMIRYIVSAMTCYTQFVCISFYQLSRLHYCFSHQQLHKKKGYPQWVFTVMVIIGIIVWISALILRVLVDTLPAECRYTDDFSLFYRYRERAVLFDGDLWTDERTKQIYHLWFNVVSVSGHTWDLIVLLLYLFKIYQIGKVHKSKSKANRVWDNVLFILHRIVIITVFYTICSLFLNILYSIFSVVQFSQNALIHAIVTEFRISGVIAAYNLLYFLSILLMMDHNTNIYIVFFCIFYGISV